MSKNFIKILSNKIAVVGFIAFFSLIFITQKNVRAEHEGHGIENVNKLKYADPVKDIHLYLCAFHIAKNNPDFEIEAHHYCSMRDLNIGKADLHQCVIYDSKEAPAKLLGIEYIVSNETYQSLRTMKRSIGTLTLTKLYLDNLLCRIYLTWEIQPLRVSWKAGARHFIHGLIRKQRYHWENRY